MLAHRASETEVEIFECNDWLYHLVLVAEMDRQMTLEEQAARLKWNEKDRLIRDVKLKNTPKHILWVLNSHIGGMGSWVMPLSRLALETGLHVKSLKRNLDFLSGQHIISFDLEADPIPIREPQYRFRICWGNVLALPKCSEQPKPKRRKSNSGQKVKSADKMSKQNGEQVGQNVQHARTKCPTRSDILSNALLISVQGAIPLSKSRASVGEIPPELATPEFETAWEEWCVYRKKSKHPNVTETGAKRALAKLAKFGVEIAIAAIHESISNDWQGLFPEKLQRTHANGKPSIEDRNRAEFEKAKAAAKAEERNAGNSPNPGGRLPRLS
jgi:hypothetical protein